MTLRREVDDRLRTVFLEQSTDQRLITDVAVHEEMIRARVERRERIEIAGVGQGIEIDDTDAAGLDQSEHKITADEARATGNQPSLHAKVVSRRSSVH